MALRDQKEKNWLKEANANREAAEKRTDAIHNIKQGSRKEEQDAMNKRNNIRTGG